MLLKRLIGILSLFICFTTFASDKAPSAAHFNWLDNKIKPGDDFFHFANQKWLDSHPIPKEYATWSQFHELVKRNNERLNQILISLSQTVNKIGTIEQKLGDFYFSGMDETAIEKSGIVPIQPLFEYIDRSKKVEDLASLFARFQLMGISIPFALNSTPDYKKAKRTIAEISQAGLGLPNRDYYLKQDKKHKQILQTYQNHIEKMFLLIGDNMVMAKSHAISVIKLETDIAKISLPIEDLRDPKATYHPSSLKKVISLLPKINMAEFFKSAGLAKPGTINVATPSFFKELNHLIKKDNLEQWKQYTRWHVIHHFAPYINKRFVDENFKFKQAILGVKEQLKRWQRIVNDTNAFMGFALGRIYIERFFDTKTKKQVTLMAKHIKRTLSRRLRRLTWMSKKTKRMALKKLARMKFDIGYPNKWQSYADLKIARGVYVLNVLRAMQFNRRYELNKIGKPTDVKEWPMPPQIVNAFYDPTKNRLAILAGIIQPPFYDENAPSSFNYGAIGFVIGHEMTHGFDDQGAQFDSRGNFANWWTKKDYQRFRAKTRCITEQYSKYTVDDGKLHLKGKLVTGEASADLGGLSLAYNAFITSKGYKKNRKLNGFTPKQQFFISAAHAFAGKVRKKSALLRQAIDPHPPFNYRVNGTLANMKGFAKAFSLDKDAKMINHPRCQIW